MIPGEYRTQNGQIELNKGRKTISIIVINTGDRPIQVGSHYHFYEVNRALSFDRQLALGMRLNIIAGTAVRFEPGEEKPVELVAYGGTLTIFGFNALINGEIPITAIAPYSANADHTVSEQDANASNSENNEDTSRTAQTAIFEQRLQQWKELS